MDGYITAAAVIGAATGAALLTAWSTRKGRISEFRQVWINELRSDIAQFLGATRQYRDAPPGERREQLRYKADVIYNRIELRINPRQNRNKEQDDKFLAALKLLFKKPPDGSSDETKGKADKKWHSRFNCAMSRARELLKREWQVTKSPLLAGAGRVGNGEARNVGGRLAGWARGWFPALGLTVAVAAAIVALVQLGDTKRAVALGSFATIREGYSAPKTQFYAYAFENSERLLEDRGEINFDVVMRMYTQEYLRSIEFVAAAYASGLLDEEARRFVTKYVKEDIEDLLLCFYSEDERGH